MRFALVFCALSAPALACEVEDWTIQPDGLGNSWMRGAATCVSGWISYRVYEGEALTYSGEVPINGFAFAEPLHDYVPEAAPEVRFHVEAD